ncbi:hypothetical protein BCR33DRAFT_711350 [Rhizoclosmatium globosum]|uniref:Uncharacterized protein n=1 Tax=Rhizoclosmatium globosum TaxID=329046 RepID=A0A1Y2D1F0_9FUNG|nr:hypothetical protein BCR33DRAFT_711350 [Rhizoclosmatium globosum]|eukprot:ORY52946.1 hypothetical protein BCR33DRAFT_711350 [Rhizoclosmatium globosum]
MCFIWSTCACYSVSLSHNNLALAVPQSIQTLSVATIETCFTHFSWTISFGIIKRNSSRMVFGTMSTLVSSIIYIAAAITKLPVMITINRIWTAIVGAAVSLFNMYLMAIFSFYLMKLNNDLNDSGSSKSSKIANSRLPSTTSVVGEESRKQQRQFRTIARHGIWASLFCVAAVITFALGLIERFNVWVNVIQASVCYWLNMEVVVKYGQPNPK